MASKRKTFSQLSERSQRRITRAGDSYHLTRKQIRDRYNRGSFNPLSRDPSKHVPTEFRQYSDEGQVDWREAALGNMRIKLGAYFKFNDDAVVYNVYTQASEPVLKVMAIASEDELIAYARLQDDNGSAPQLPPGLDADEIGYYTNGKWNNIFWYH